MWHHIAFHRAHRGVEGIDRVAERSAHLLQVADEGSQALVQLGAEFAYLGGVFRGGGLAPTVRNHLEQRHESGGRCDDDALLERVLEKVRALDERRRQKLIARQEQHGEFRTLLELFPVTFLAEFADSLLHLHGVTREGCVARVVVLGFDGVEVGVEWRLGVDDQIACLRHMHQQIRTQ